MLALQIFIRLDEPEFRGELFELGSTLLREGRTAEGADELRRAIDILRNALGEDHVETARARAALPR